MVAGTRRRFLRVEEVQGGIVNNKAVFVWAVVAIIAIVTTSLTIIELTAKNPTPLLGLVGTVVAPTMLTLLNLIRTSQVADKTDQIETKVNAIHEEVRSSEDDDNAQ